MNLAASFYFPLAITNKAAKNSCGSGVHFMGMGFQLEQRKFSTYRLSTFSSMGCSGWIVLVHVQGCRKILKHLAQESTYLV